MSGPDSISKAFGSVIPTLEVPPAAFQAKEDLPFFTEDVLGGTNKPFHTEILKILQSYPRRYGFLMPPGYGKSTLASVRFPLWRIIKDRDVRIGIVSNTENQSVEWLREIETELKLNEKIRDWYGEFIPSQRSLTWTDTEKIVVGRSQTATHLTLKAVGVKGATLGKRFDLIICDDLLDLENTSTSYQRAELLRWFRLVLLPRLEPTGSIYVVGTRFHPNDIYDSLEKDGWPFFRLSALDQDGQSTWPERFPTEILHDIKKNMGSILFNLQFMNAPVNLEGNLFKSEWLRFYENLPPNLPLYMSIDPSASASDSANRYAIVVVGYSEEQKRIYIVDILWGRASLLRQAEVIEHSAGAWRPKLVGIETNAAQVMLADYLKDRIPFPIKLMPSHISKEVRLIVMSAMFEAGKAFLPGHLEGGKWEPTEQSRAFIEEFLNYPKAATDDILDAMAKAFEICEMGAPTPAYGVSNIAEEVYAARPRLVRMFR